MRRYWLLMFVVIGIVLYGLAVFPPAAEASSIYTVLSCPGVQANAGDQALGKVQIDISDSAALTSPDILTVCLPTGVTMNCSTPDSDVNSGGSVRVTAPATINGSTNPLSGDGAFEAKVESTNTFDILVHPGKFAGTGTGAGQLLVDFYAMDTAGCSNGYDIMANFMAPTGSGFSTGYTTIGYVGWGSDIRCGSVSTVSAGQNRILGRVSFSELHAGSLAVNSANPTTQNTIILTLPEGVTWAGIQNPSYPVSGSAEGQMGIDHFNGRNAYVTVNESTVNGAEIEFNPVINIENGFKGNVTITVSGSNTGVNLQTISVARVPGIKIYRDNTRYTLGQGSDHIQTITLNQGINGLQYFTVEASLTSPHDGTETLVFSLYRSGAQQSVVARINDFDSSVLTTKVGLNVRAGDIIKVYIVDALSNAANRNPAILET